MKAFGIFAVISAGLVFGGIWALGILWSFRALGFTIPDTGASIFAVAYVGSSIWVLVALAAGSAIGYTTPRKSLKNLREVTEAVKQAHREREQERQRYDG